MTDARDGVRLDRRTLLASSVAVAAGLAGCNDESDQQSEPGDPATYVPASASVVVGVDMALTDSEETIQLLEAYANEEDLLERFEARTGLDPERIDRVLTFSEEPSPDRRTFVVDADIDESEARSAAEEHTGSEYESVDFDNGTVYVPSSGDGPAVGTTAEGQYVVGPESSVKTALNVFQGDAEGLGDPLRSAYEDARAYDGSGGNGGGTATDGGSQNATDDGGGQGGSLTQYVTAATSSPREYLPDDDSEQVPAGASLDLYGELETATATYAAGGGEVALDVELRAPDAETAQRVEEFTETIVMFLRSQANDEVGAQLARIEFERSESVVTVSYRSPVEDAVTLVEWLSGITSQ